MNNMNSVSRILAIWCPDWPLAAALLQPAPGEEAAADRPAAVLAKNTVTACNQAARDDGVRRGMRRRDAQSRCPELTLLDANPDRDARAFEPVLDAVAELIPGVAPLRPGLLALRAPARYYGGESEAAAVLAERLVESGVWDCRAGIADDLFTAEQAARRALPQDSLVVAPGGSAAFLRELPVEALARSGQSDGADLPHLLRRLGIHTLGDFAALPARDVHTRFGAAGARMHRLAGGACQARPATRVPPPELACREAFEPPLDSAETVCFSIRRTAERFVAGLAGRDLVCTGVRIEVDCDGVLASARSWLHPGWFTAADLVDRVHWQLQPAGRRIGLPGPVGEVRLLPETTDAAGDHAEGLWGGGAEEQVQRGVARVQAMIGYDAVVVPRRQGGRSPADRQALVGWGERATGLRPVAPPWPGSIPGPAPARVFAEPRPAAVVGEDGQAVRVTARGAVTCIPARFRPAAGAPEQPVAAWAGPWPVDELWWEETGRRVARFQVVGADGQAWLMSVEDGRWWTEAHYD